MKKLSIFLDTNFAPVALMLICLAAYAPLLPFTGFYGDEWQMVYEYIVHQGAGLATYLYYDGHPLATWGYVLSFNLLGVQPWAWQLYSLVLRLLSILGFWMVLRRVWPQKPREIWMAAVLFALYPQFHLQAQAVAYYEVWLSFIFLWLSFYFSIRSLQEPQRFWIFTMLAVFFKICHPLSSEYTWGTEVMRPFLLWFALEPVAQEQVKTSIKRVMTVFCPHAFISIVMFVWRVAIYQSPTGYRAEPKLIESLVKDPWATLQSVVLYIVPDTVLILFTSWQKVFQPATFDFGRLFNILSFLIALVGTGLAWLFLNRDRADGNQKVSNWATGALLTGVATLAFGMLPFYVGGYFPSTGTEPWSGRFILGSLPGIALLIVLLIAYFIPMGKRQAVFFALLTGLMVAWQLQAGDEFRRMWAGQADFYRELLWRAPDMKPNTAILVDSDALPPILALGFTLNTVYEQTPTSEGQLPFWIFRTEYKAISTDLSQPANGNELRDGRFTTFFSGNSRDAIAVDFRLDQSQCLWVINPDQALYAPKSRDLKQIANTNPIDRISENLGQKNQVLEDLFANVEPPSWCYYFEKADLARQMGNWETIKSLWEQVEKQNIKPIHGMEYLPFIEAYARLNDWDKAFVLSRQASRTSPEMASALCPFWQRLDQELPANDGKTYFSQETNNLLGCKK
jgi:hypothetical protein